jgi:hypothetical protein
MFPSRYFANRYFAPRYWPNIGAETAGHTVSLSGMVGLFPRLSGECYLEPTIGGICTLKQNFS